MPHVEDVKPMEKRQDCPNVLYHNKITTRG